MPRLEGPQPVQIPGPDGHSVALHDFGGEGPALLFANATGMHGWAWSVVAQQLVGAPDAGHSVRC